MKFLILILVIISYLYAYQYTDFVWAHEYVRPSPVSDTLTQNCDSLEIDQAICDTLDRNNLTIKEKKNLILNGINPDAYQTNFSFIEDWNNKIKFTKYAPNGTPVYNSRAIRDAWVKILYFNPSVDFENKTFLNKTGTIYSQLNFTFVVTNQTFPQDCRTNYDIRGYDYYLKTYVNSNKINLNNEKRSNFTLNTSDNLFETKLDIESQYLIYHYKWKQRCGSTRSGRTICYMVCEIDSIDNHLDRLSINDTKKVSFYNFTREVESIIDADYSNLTDFWFSLNTSRDFANIFFASNNSFISINGVDYYLRYTNEPHNILNYEAVQKNESYRMYGLSILEHNITNNSTLFRKIHAFIPNANSCTLTVRSHFEIEIIAEFCNKTTDEPTINISLIRKTNRTLELELYFYDKKRNISLGNKELKILYAGLEQRAITNNLGKAIVILPNLKENALVKINFLTDMKTKSAESFFVTPQEELAIFDFLSTASFAVTIYLIKKVVMNAAN